MKHHSGLSSSQKAQDHEDMHCLLLRGRSLHDQAVFNALASLNPWIYRFFKKGLSAATDEEKFDCQDHGGASLTR